MSGHHRGGQQLLHRIREDIVQLVHGDVPASLLGMRVDEAARTVQDAAGALVHDELLDVRLIHEVGSEVVTEPTVSDPLLGVGVHEAALVVQDRDVLHVPPSYENRNSVGSTFLNETRF